MAITVPVSGPVSPELLVASVTASGRFSASPGRAASTDRPAADLGPARSRSTPDGSGEPVAQADELRHESRRRARVHVRGRRELLDSSCPHHADSVSDRQCFLLIVGHEQGGDARSQAGSGGSDRAAGRGPWRRARTAARPGAAPAARSASALASATSLLLAAGDLGLGTCRPVSSAPRSSSISSARRSRSVACTPRTAPSRHSVHGHMRNRE